MEIVDTVAMASRDHGIEARDGAPGLSPTGPRRCPQCRQKVPKRPVGRPRRQVAVEKLVLPYKRTSSVSAAAKELGIPSSTARDRLKAVGVLVTAGDRGREHKPSTSSTTQRAGHDRQRYAP